MSSTVDSITDETEPSSTAGSAIQIDHNRNEFPKPAAVLFLVSLVCYFNAGACDFVFDDISAIKDNKDLRPTQPLHALLSNDFWGTPMEKENSHKSYRPFTVLTFRWNYAFHELEPFGYHFVNVVLHAVNSVLVYRLFLLFAQHSSSFIGALLFAVHPIHTEAVTGVVGRAELLSTLFGLSLFLFFALYPKRDWRWNTFLPVCLLLALFSKEQGIMIVAICTVYQLVCKEKMTVFEILHAVRCIFSEKPRFDSRVVHSFKRIWVLIASSIGLMFWRMKIMKGQLPVFTTFDNPASVTTFPTKHLTYLYLPSLNIFLLLLPKDLLCDYTMGTVPLLKSVLDLRIFSVVLFIIMFGKFIQKALLSADFEERAILTMACAWMVFPFIPASNLFFPVGFVVAERVLYMPSVGFCLLVGYGYQKICENFPRRHTVFLCLLLAVSTVIAFSSRIILRNYDWKNEDTLFRSGLLITQSNAKIFNNVGHVLEKSKNFDEALKFFKSATIAQPDDIGAWNNVGRTLNALNRTQEAEAAWRTAKDLLPKPRPGQQYQARIAPQHLNVLLNLGNIMAKDPTRLQEADQIYRQAISMRTDYVEAYINRGDVLLKLNRTLEAIEVYKKALGIDATNADIYYNIGVVYTELKEAEKAFEYFDKALDINPDHILALLNSAVLMGEVKQPRFHTVIEQRLGKVLNKGADANAFFQMGLLMMDKNDPDAAAVYFRKTVEAREDHKSALFNLALLMNTKKNYKESLHYALKLVHLFPDHHKAWILIGDLYINYIKDPSKAEEAYRKILATEPTNFQAHHNFCVTLIEQDKLTDADHCMTNLAILMREDENYLNSHYRTIYDRLEKRKLALAPVFK